MSLDLRRQEQGGKYWRNVIGCFRPPITYPTPPFKICSMRSCTQIRPASVPSPGSAWAAAHK
ncbi:MAG TPA: hypothetical protein PKV38_09105 [bacterium]|nr:hypothetical protein [bacterium]